MTYKIKDLFEDIYRSEPYVKSDLIVSEQPQPGFISFISRTGENNGCDCFALKDKDMSIESGNAITIGDTTSTIFYQPVDFITGDHIIICRSEWLDQYTALFVVTLLNAEKYRFSYGRAFKIDILKETEISLPTKDDMPDWGLIREYVKSLPYGDLL